MIFLSSFNGTPREAECLLLSAAKMAKSRRITHDSSTLFCVPEFSIENNEHYFHVGL
jgi:hypothetical protein